jgi:DNA-binding transcriptional LysR family regulator
VVGGDVAFDPGVTRRRFRIACADPIASVVAPALVDAFRRGAPFATFSSRSAFLDQALRAVRRGQVDVALGVFRQIPPGLAAMPLYDEEYCVIARRGHPLIAGPQVDARTYATVGHVFVGNPEGALADQIPIDREEMYATYGALPGPDVIRTHAYVSLWETAMLIVASTDAMADCPRRLAGLYAARLGLQVLDPPYRPDRMVVRAVRRDGVEDAGLDWLMAKLSDAVGGAG